MIKCVTHEEILPITGSELTSDERPSALCGKRGAWIPARPPCVPRHRYRANEAHVRQSRPDSSRGFKAKAVSSFQVVYFRVCVFRVTQSVALHRVRNGGAVFCRIARSVFRLRSSAHAGSSAPPHHPPPKMVVVHERGAQDSWQRERSGHGC